jgi:ABC-type Fe3+ transport system permease subunit
MTTFTTTITAMYTLPQVEGQTDVVVNAMWEVTGVQDTHTASIGGNSQFTLTQGSGFTPYASLTEAQVLTWIPESQITSAQQCVQGQIDSMITPPVSPSSQPLPWVAA